MTIPNNWEPRPYQVPLWNSFGHGKQYQRAAVVWHRRAGKDSCALNLTAREMFKRTGTYWHLLPEQAQARKVVWNGIDREGRRIIDQFLPSEIRLRKSEQEMLIECVSEKGDSGSIWQLAGADNYDSLVGSNPVGVVFSEWPLGDPAAWEYIRPILVENGGWAMFIYTPRGMNHGFTTYQNALGSDQWFSSLLTVDDTGIITAEDIQAEREAGMSEDKIRQEFYCSFEASNEEQFIGRDVLVDAVGRDVYPWQRSIVWGVDVARFGDDRSALAKRHGNRLMEPVTWWHGNDLMETTGRIVREWNETPVDSRPTSINVDVIGVGAGVVDRLREQRLPVVGVNVGERPIDPNGKYLRRGDELWGAMRDWFNSREVTMPRDEMLIVELSNRFYTIESTGKLRMESKADMKKRGLKSPDIADAFVLTFAGGDRAMLGRNAGVAEMGYNEFGYDDRRAGRQVVAVME